MDVCEVRPLTRLRPLVIFGTRPEAIKMAPVVAACRGHGEVEPIVCLTGQHRELLAQVIEYFGIEPDVRLDLMTADQPLARLTARCVEGIDATIAAHRPDCVVAQGDTTTVMAAALSAFYRRTPFVHVEAGLRTGNLQAPWPEELNRRIADLTAALCCAPTRRAAENLAAEGVAPERIDVTGNTVIDALLETVGRERADPGRWERKHAGLGGAPLVLVTAHRRESFGPGLERISRAVRTLAERFPDHRLVYPVHLNPNVQEPVRRALAGAENVHLVDPPAYPEFVWLMDRSVLILTDSGGVQEEAPSLGKPVVVMRDRTDRPELVEAGAALLVGTSVETIVETTAALLTDPARYAACRIERSPYGDGHAAERIVERMVARGW